MDRDIPKIIKVELMTSSARSNATYSVGLNESCAKAAWALLMGIEPTSLLRAAYWQGKRQYLELTVYACWMTQTHLTKNIS